MAAIKYVEDKSFLSYYIMEWKMKYWFFSFKEYLPPSPDNIDSSLEETNGAEPSKLIAEAASKFEFTKVECLLFIFHTVGKQAPEFLTDNPEVLKELKVRP